MVLNKKGDDVIYIDVPKGYRRPQLDACPTSMSNNDPVTARTPKVQFSAKTPPLLQVDSDTFISRPSSVAGTDEEHSDDYDWSDEEDLVDREAKFEQKMGKTDKSGRHCFKRYHIHFFKSFAII